MTDKPDPAKDAGRTDSSGQKRPHATLDLKATEVRPPSPPAGSASASSSAAASSATTPPTGAKAASSSAAQPDVKPGADAKGASEPSKPSSGSGPTASPGAKGASTPPPTKPQQSGSGAGGFFSHLAAGLIGGGLVYAGAALLGPGLESNSQTDATAQLAARVAALESLPEENAKVSELSAKLGDAESRLAKLDQVEKTLADISAAQGTLQAETKALADASQRGDGTDRLAKLEEQLSMIAASAPNAEGRIPQLAAITGKVSDLESSLSNQITALRKNIPEEINERVSAVAEASETAKSATARLDRELTQLRTDLARGVQKTETAKADADRLTASIEAVREETAKLSSAIGELRTSFETQLKSTAKPGDIAAAVDPVANKLAALEENVQGVVKSEETRKQNAEKIVLSLELSNLKRALDRGQGQGYGPELAEVQKAAGGTLDLSSLERFKDTGVATLAELKSEFRPVMNAVIDADSDQADGTVLDRLMAGAKSVVRVRKISHDANDASTEAIVARIERALNEGRLDDVIAQANALPQRAQAPIEDWLIKVTARNSVDQAIASVETGLKTSLSGAPEPAPAPAPPTEPAPAQAPAQD